MDDLMTALETYIDARIAVDRIETHPAPGEITGGLGRYGSDLLVAAVKHSDEARGRVETCLRSIRG